MISIALIGFLVRFGVPTVFPLLPLQLSRAVELSTPINSYFSLQEAFFYLQHQINPYDGGVNHHPPLVVMFFYTIREALGVRGFEVFINGFFAAIDVAIALQLVKINHWYNEYQSQRLAKPVKGLSDSLIAAFYLFNPLIVLTNLAHTTVLVMFLLLSLAIVQLVKNQNLPRSMMCLAMASYVSYSPVFLLPPMLALAHAILPPTEPDFHQHLGRIYFQGTAIFVSTCGLLMLCSIVLTSSLDFLDQCYGVIIRFDKILPNVGLWWYFFTEMFDFFTPFYIGVFNLLWFIFVIPITLRFFEFRPRSGVDPKSDSKRAAAVGDSFFALVLSYIWISFLKSYPTIADLGFGLSLAPIFSGTILPYCKLAYVTGLTLLISLLLSPIFYYCWIVLGNGNSNFFYSINLIWGGVHVLILIDSIWGKLVADYCEEHQVPIEERSSISLTQL